MGLFGFVGGIASSAIKVTTTPITTVVDVASVITGGDGSLTSNTIKSVGDDLENAIDEIMQ